MIKWVLILLIVICNITSVVYAEAVFDNGGVPWSFFGQINAVNYDLGGTPPGTYTNLTITATQASAVNSPQSISPPLTGTVPRGPFDNGGANWAFLSTVPAINYDLGGQGFGYNVPTLNQVCMNGSTIYRSDSVNFKASTFNVNIPFQLGCSAIPMSYNYSINASQPCPCTVTILTGDTTSGGVWNILIDGVQVATAPTSNTGNFNVFQPSTSSQFNMTTGNGAAGNHIMTLQVAGGDFGFNGSGDLLTWQGNQVTSLSPPPQAANAGFTTLALNNDFSQALYATTSNWLDCTNSNPSLVWTNFPGDPYCSFPQITDPLNSSLKVIDVNWPNGQPIMGSFADVAITYHDSTHSLTFPNMYFEGTYRIDSTGANSLGAATLGSIYACAVDSTGTRTGTNVVEVDLAELFTGNGPNSFADASAGYPGCVGGGAPFSAWYSYAANNLPPGWSPYNYHKYGALITSDGATSVYVCEFVDDILQNSCQSVSVNAATYLYRNYLFLSLVVGNLSAPTQHTYFQNIHVWSCPNWNGPPGVAANMCYGHTLVQNGNLNYWQ